MGDWTPRFSLVNRIYRELLKMLLFPACIYRSLKSSTLAQEPDDSIDEFFKFVFPQVVKALSLLTFPCTTYIAAFFLFDDVLSPICLFHSQALSHVRYTAVFRWQFPSCVTYQPSYLMLPVIDNL